MFIQPAALSVSRLKRRKSHFKNKWVYFCDADERVTAELAEKMLSVVADNTEYAAFRVQRRDYFMGRWLRHVTPSPFNIRLFKIGAVKFERITNPYTNVSGSVGDLKEHFDHYPFSKGISHWVNKHNWYSSLEAAEINLNAEFLRDWNFKDVFFNPDANIRRKAQKNFYYSLPFRPLLMFFGLYFLKMGFLDGYPGFIFSVLRAFYELIIVLKNNELQVK